MLSTVATVTSEIKPQNLQVIWNVQFITVRAGMDDPTSIPQPAQRKHQNHKFRSPMDVQSVRPTWFEDVAAPKDPTLQPN